MDQVKVPNVKYLTWPGHQGTCWGDYYSPEWKWQTYTTATITLWHVSLAFYDSSFTVL